MVKYIYHCDQVATVCVTEEYSTRRYYVRHLRMDPIDRHKNCKTDKMAFWGLPSLLYMGFAPFPTQQTFSRIVVFPALALPKTEMFVSIIILEHCNIFHIGI